MFKILVKLLKIKSLSMHVSKRTNGMMPVFINGKEVSVPPHFTILQALRREKVVTPSFCYHERLSIAGNCRMCLVQIEGIMKPQVACAMPLRKGMRIRTNSELTMQAWEGVLELILANHPLDCPICDQGGECDLQDLSMHFGNDRSRFTDIHFAGKRAVEDKDLGPFIRTKMNRCIHCTRCIRFGAQIAGVEILGTTGRGCDTQVGTYVDKMFLSEISGNIIDLCPVGALTAIPYMFKARPWEVRKTNSIDVTDATGTNIQLNYRFDRVLRILPREHDEINQEWVSDKGRWSLDSTQMQRLSTPMIRNDCFLEYVDWDRALPFASDLIMASTKNIAAIVGPHTNAETLVACKDFFNQLKSDNLFIPHNINSALSGTDLRCMYSLNIPMKDIPKADCIVLIGTNPRFEAPILNVWIRQAYITNECDIYVVGCPADYNYQVCYLGTHVVDVLKIKKVIEKAKNPLIFIGMSVVESKFACNIFKEVLSCSKGDDKWPVVNVVPLEASTPAALEIGYKPGGITFLQKSPPNVLVLLGCDSVFDRWKPSDKCKIIYIGFQGDVGAQKAEVILPGCAYTEGGGTYMNMEYRSQLAQPAVTPVGKARRDWKIIRALAQYCSICLPYDDLSSLRYRMEKISPNLTKYDELQPRAFINLMKTAVGDKKAELKSGGEVIHAKIKYLREYYCTDVYTCNSKNMVNATHAAFKYECCDYAKD